jgi:DNA-binding MarR family transcriptional regulator
MNQRAHASELGGLFDATVMLYHRLTAAAEAIHRAGALSGPRRTVLSAIGRAGPHTVASLARVRGQSRQRLQPLINGLIASGLAESRPNPAHRQSPLIALTPKGTRVLATMVERERRMRAGLKPASSPASLIKATAVLRDVAVTVEQQLPALLKRRR